MEYLEFLESKKKRAIKSGFQVNESDLHPKLKDFQKYILPKALLHGKYALFADTGLGKTFMQLEWAKHVTNHTKKPVLVLAPLAVVQQTINEGKKWGYSVFRLNELTNEDPQIYITNYDQLENIDCSNFAGIVLDECFAPDTKIQVWRANKLHEVYIKDCLAGDKILNCTGLDTIKAIKSKKIQYAIKIRFNGKEVISSPRHPYFTQRGWVSAKDLQRSDFIMSTDKAMRVLRNGISDSKEKSIEDQVLRDILLCEMENESTGIFSQSSQSNSCGKEREIKVDMAENSRGSNSGRKDQEFESNEKSIDTSESFSYITEDESQTFSAWGEWTRDDIATAIDEGCIVRRLDTGICYITGDFTKRLPNELQSRLSSLKSENCDRIGWEFSLLKEGIGYKERRKTEFFRVDSFEVLEQRDNRLDKYRNENGQLYFYDLEIERHPSFTINEGLVHNSSILKNESGKKRDLIIDKFKLTPYKLACSATPSPNDHMELGNHAEFLDVCTYFEMLAQYFVHDGGETSKWRLRKHAETDFWEFVLSWAIAIDNPKTFGFDGSGYDLDPVNYIEHLIEVQSDKSDLFGEAIVSATDLHRELKLSRTQRFEVVLDILSKQSEDQFLIWGLNNDECTQLNNLLSNSFNVKGSDSPEFKAEKLNGFGNNEFQYLITKTSIAGMGLNYQNANNMIFLAYDFSFEKFYQGVRRMHRFGQTKTVNIHILTPKNQINVKGKIIKSETKHKTMIQELAKKSSQYIEKNIEVDKSLDVITDNYKLLFGDCVLRAKDIADNELDLSVWSPPFPGLYVYSNLSEDMNNVKDPKEYEQHFKYMIPEVKRTLKPGRICAVHCMDIPVQKGKEGWIGLRDYSGMLIDWFEEFGFIYHSRVTIWKNPVTEMQRTKALGLLHKTIKKDSTMSRVGIPDYVLFFRNEGENEIPITHQDKDSSKKDYLPVDLWQKYASPVWMDIDYSDTLNYTCARDNNDERHITPLQLPTIERVIHLYSNEGETVGSFFGGIGSEGYKALKMGRKSVSIELKESYFKINCQNHKNAILEKSTLTLF